MDRKKNYINTLINLSDEHKKILIATADNVGASQMASVRKSLRGKAILLMGKNTLMKKAFTTHKEQNPKLTAILPYLNGNIGLIFTDKELKEVRDIVNNNKVDAPAKAGAISPVKVVIQAQNTGMEPTKTSFFQALNINTKITKGTVEILNDFTLLNIGDKVDSSKAVLLKMLNLNPFSYGLVVKKVYDDGVVYDPDVLDVNAESIFKLFQEGLSNISGLALATNYNCEASIHHLMSNSFKDFLAISVQTSYSFKQAEKIKEFISNPSKFITAKVEKPKKEEKVKKEEKKEEVEKVEEKEESGGDIGFGLFGQEEGADAE